MTLQALNYSTNEFSLSVRITDLSGGLMGSLDACLEWVMKFIATKARVSNRGSAPDDFLNELVEWGVLAPDDVFTPNQNPADIYADVKPLLGPWMGLSHRRAAMLEVMRVHAGFESSWNWNEGVDHTNQTSLHNRNGEETGIFQVSYDSTYFADDKLKLFLTDNGILDVDSFIPVMKSDHKFALGYYARLVRISIKWAGPLLRHEVDPWLSRAAVDEFERLLESRPKNHILCSQ